MKRNSHARECFAGLVRELVEDGPVVAEPDCVLSAGMEMVCGFGLLRDVPVLLPDFVAEFLHIDKIEDVCHRYLVGNHTRCSAPGWIISRAARINESGRHAITLATDQKVGRHRSLTFDVDLTPALEPVRQR